MVVEVVRVVTKEGERTFTGHELGLPETPTDAQIIAEVERVMESELKNYTVTRADGKVMVSPSPVFG